MALGAFNPSRAIVADFCVFVPRRVFPFGLSAAERARQQIFVEVDHSITPFLGSALISVSCAISKQSS